MSQVIRQEKPHDVCIIGSGAGGGTAAKVLTEGGLSVVMLEAGPVLYPQEDFEEHVALRAAPPWRRRWRESPSRAKHGVYGSQWLLGDRR